MSLAKELADTEEKFGLRLRNEAGLALDNWHNQKIEEYNIQVNIHKERTVWAIAMSLLGVALCVCLWIINRVKLKNRINILLKDVLLLREEGKQYGIRESLLKEEINVYRDSVVNYRSLLETNAPTSNKSNALDLWFKKMDDLYKQYYLTDISAMRKKGLVDVISKEMEYLRNDDELLSELEHYINASHNNILTNIYESLRRVTSDQRRLVVFLYFGFSIEAICAIFDINQNIFYNRKCRLLAHLNKSTSENKDDLIKRLSQK